jgi:hypothetical protein
VAIPSYPNVPGVVRELQVELSRAPAQSRSHLHEVARRRIHAPQEILDWAKRDHRWSFTLAEVLRDPTARPHDLAARLVLAIADELEQERETLLMVSDPPALAAD